MSIKTIFSDYNKLLDHALEIAADYPWKRIPSYETIPAIHLDGQTLVLQWWEMNGGDYDSGNWMDNVVVNIPLDVFEMTQPERYRWRDEYRAREHARQVAADKAEREAWHKQIEDRDRAEYVRLKKKYGSQ